jgi:hypothetical protein
MQPSYERSFYQTLDEGVARSAEQIVPIVLEYLQPQSVVDVGCGTGTWLSAFHRRGVADILGFEGPWVDRDLLQIPTDRFRTADLAQPLRSDRRFDLVVSLEVAEHLPHTSAEIFIDTLTQLGQVVLFSAAIPYQGGQQHINERWPSYWATLFARRGFRAVDCLRPRLLHNTQIQWWYAQNMFFAVDSSQLDRCPALAEAAKHSPPQPLDLVHPLLFLESTARAKEPKELLHGTLGATRDRWLIPRRRHAAERRAAFARWPPAL